MVHERLRDLRKSHGLTQEQFGQKIGAKQGNVADWERGRSSPSLETMNQIVKIYNINLHWLFTGEGKMHIQSQQEQELEVNIRQKVFNILRDELTILENDPSFVPSKNDDFLFMPVVGDIAAGEPMPFISDTDPIQHIAIPKRKLSNPSNCEVLRVNGDSMEPKIEHSDIVVIRKDVDWQSCHNKVVAVRTSDGLTLKKLVLDEVKRTAVLMPYNPKYSAIVLDEDSKICGQLVFIVRQC